MPIADIFKRGSRKNKKTQDKNQSSTTALDLKFKDVQCEINEAKTLTKDDCIKLQEKRLYLDLKLPFSSEKTTLSTKLTSEESVISKTDDLVKKDEKQCDTITFTVECGTEDKEDKKCSTEPPSMKKEQFLFNKNISSNYQVEIEENENGSKNIFKKSEQNIPEIFIDKNETFELGNDKTEKTIEELKVATFTNENKEQNENSNYVEDSLLDDNKMAKIANINKEKSMQLENVDEFDGNLKFMDIKEENVKESQYVKHISNESTETTVTNHKLETMILTQVPLISHGNHLHEEKIFKNSNIEENTIENLIIDSNIAENLNIEENIAENLNMDENMKNPNAEEKSLKNLSVEEKFNENSNEEENKNEMIQTMRLESDELQLSQTKNESKPNINEKQYLKENNNNFLENNLCKLKQDQTVLTKYDEEKEILDAVKNTIDDMITQLEKEKFYVQLIDNIDELQMNRDEIHDELNVDPSLYSNLSENIASKALSEALTEINLINFEEDEKSNVNNEEIFKDEKTSQYKANSETKLNLNLEFTDSDDLVEDILPQPSFNESPNSNQNWKVGYLHVKLPHKARGKGNMKVWQKKWVVIQADEFAVDSDKKNSYIIISIYHSESGNSRNHSASFWKTLSSKKAVIFRCVSKTHPYAFTVADGDESILHLGGHSETECQEWMAAIRNILWPPSPVIQLEKVLNGNEFDVSFIDNKFSLRAGLFGTYGCMTVTNRKLILTHPQSGYVIQEWYLNTVDKFHIEPQSKAEDINKVIVMHTSSDSSTGRGELRLFCNEAVEFLKSLASTIHKVLQYYCKGNEKKYKKELDELEEWFRIPQPLLHVPGKVEKEEEDYYKVPKRQVRSLLDIPNFIFNKPIGELSHDRESITSSTSRLQTYSPKLMSSQTSISIVSHDSGISTATSSSDFLNCSHTSFCIGEAEIRRSERRESSSSESLDPYSPPVSPLIPKKTNEQYNTKIGETS